MNCINKIDIDKLLMKISKHRALRRKSQSSDLFWSAFFPYIYIYKYISFYCGNTRGTYDKIIKTE